MTVTSTGSPGALDRARGAGAPDGRRRGRRVLAIVLAGTVLVAACSADDDAAERATGGSTGPAGTTAPASSDTSDPDPSAPPPSGATPTTAGVVPGQPVWDGDFPDPSIVWADGEYHAYATQGSTGLVQHLRSPDLASWEPEPGGVLDAVPTWGSPYSVWAPTVAEVGGQWVMWYVVHEPTARQACLSTAVADDPDGPFVDDTAEPLVCPTELGGAIDPSPVQDEDGSWWLLWKSDGVAVDEPSSIWIQPLADDGRAVVGEPIELVTTDQPWEQPHVEAPSMVRWEGRWLLLYSGAWWNEPTYGVGLAVCETLTGPCTKPLDGPVLASDGDLVGPGGAEVFTTAEGEVWVAYHGWLGVAGYPSRRALWLAPLADLVPPGL